MNTATPSARGPIRAVVFDLDGVIRHWNDHLLDRAEAAVGLEPGSILAVAFSGELGPAAITGRLTYREWMDEVRDVVVSAHGESVAPIFEVWEANVGTVDHEMVEVLRSLRSHVVVALLSNGTTRLRRDLHVLDLLDEFDVVFNTAEIGIAKPEPAVFRHVCAALDLDPGETAFVDDVPANVEGAEHAGMIGHVFEGRSAAEQFLESLGLTSSDPQDPRR